MQDIRNIPPVRSYLLDVEIFDQLGEVANKHVIDGRRVGEFLDLTDAVVKGQLEPAQMPALIEKAFGVDAQKAKVLAADIAGYRLLPLAHYIDGIEDQIVAWGGKIADYPSKRVEKQEQSIDTQLRELADSLGLELPEHLLKRFLFISRGYLQKERDKDATVTLMKRPLNIGGLQLNDAQASAMLAKLEAFSAAHADVPSTSPAPAAQEPTAQPAEVPANSAGARDALREKLKEATQLYLQTLKPVDEVHAAAVLAPEPTEEELKVMLKEFAPGSEDAPAGELTTADYEAMLKEFAVGADTQELPPPAPVKTPSHIKKASVPKQKQKKQEPKNPPHSAAEPLPVVVPVKAVAKDVPIVNAPKKPSAPATSKKEREQAVNDALAPAVAVFKKKRIARKTFTEIATAHVKGVRDPLRTYELLKSRYALTGEELDMAFKALELARKLVQGEHAPGTAMRAAPAAAPVHALEQEVLDQRHAAMTKSMPATSVEPVLASAQVSAARTKQEELEGQKAKIDPGKLEAAEAASKPEKAKAKLSMGSAVPGQAKMEDVKFVRKLVGPVEELGNMGTTEFRRLSSDPTEAVRKVEDRLDLLEQTNFDMRIQGVNAWRKSPVNRLYLQMANEALMKGISISEIASGRRNAGEESLSPAEIQAIVALNNRIKF